MEVMTDDEYNEYCKSLPVTTYVNQWGGSHVWKVGGKVFAIGVWRSGGGNSVSGGNKDDGLAVSFKVSDHNYDVLKEQTGFRPAPYLASRGMKWIQQTDTSGKNADHLKYYIKESHRIVSLGLTKKLQKELGLNQN